MYLNAILSFVLLSSFLLKRFSMAVHKRCLVKVSNPDVSRNESKPIRFVILQHCQNNLDPYN